MRFTFRAATIAAIVVSVVSFAATSSPGYALQLQGQQFQAFNAPAPTPVPAVQTVVQPVAAPDQSAEATPAVEFTSLAQAVDAQDADVEADHELDCLATGIYFEAKGEPLAGQLAVANVILNRVDSGRFSGSVCGVLTQRGQFSFVRGGKLPHVADNAQWRRAVAVAKVAEDGLWDNPVPDALYFHARYVHADWHMTRIAQLGNHIFYR